MDCNLSQIFYILQMTWCPYQPHILERLPPECTMGRDIWQAKVPLICFYIVEWHAPDRVLRQFNLGQDVPVPVNTENSLHEMIFDARTNWIQRLANYIEIWNDRRNNVILGGAGDIYSYMDWYRLITRRFISRRNMLSDYMVSYMNLYILLDIILCLFIF